VKAEQRPPSRSTPLGIWTPASLSPKALTSRLVFLGIILTVLVVGVISLVNAVTWANKPFAGFLVNQRMVPASIGLYHWSGVKAGLKFTDKVLKANDRPVSSMKDLNAVIRSTPIGDSVRYSMDRSGKVAELAIPSMLFTWSDLVLTFGVAFLSGIIYLLLGVIVFILKPDTKVSWVFFSMCVYLSVFTIASFDIASTHWGFIRPYFFVQTFLSAGLIHLSFVFPERAAFARKRPSLESVPYVIAALLIVPLQFLYPRPAFVKIYQLVYVFLIVGAIAFVASVLHSYLKTASILARQRAKVVLFGAALAFPIPAIVNSLSLFGITLGGLTSQKNLLAIPLVVFPASIAYAIARHNLFDVDVYIKRAVGYGMLTAIVGIAYFAIQTLTSSVILAPIFGDYGEKVYPLAFAVLVVFLFNPISRRVQEGVDKIFFRKQFDYKGTISSVSNALTSMLDLDQIVKQVVHTIRTEMFIDTAGIIVLEPQKQACRAFFAGDERKPAKETLAELPVGFDDPVVALMCQEKALITRYDVEEDSRFGEVKEPCLLSFSKMAASLALPLMYQGEVRGILALGYKKSGAFYSREDIDLLNTMANQAAVAIENATTHQEVIRYAEELAASLRRIQILESIKSNLAKFVPKTVQDLIEESPEAPSLDKREIDVSVVFADITGYTRLSAQMELDQVNQLVERYFGAFLDEILRYGGDVNETAGDGLMVIFRDPDPSRHARAAALAALGILRKTREINVELQGQFQPISMHVGVNSGIAFVGATRIEGAAGTRWTYTASGPTTNVAARLSALAEGGTVVVSEETRRRMGDEFVVEDLGPQSLKNVTQPVRVYRLRAEDRAPAAARAVVERRRHPRRPVAWPVRLWIGEESFEGRAEDAGLHGVCVAGLPMHRLAVGKSYRIEITTDREERILSFAEVRNLSDRGAGMETKEPLPLG